MDLGDVFLDGHLCQGQQPVLALLSSHLADISVIGNVAEELGRDLGDVALGELEAKRLIETQHVVNDHELAINLVAGPDSKDRDLKNPRHLSGGSMGIASSRIATPPAPCKANASSIVASKLSRVFPWTR